MGWKGLAVLVALWALWDLAVVPLMGVRQVLPWELKSRLAAGEAPVLVDVRTPLEYRLFHIPGAISAPYPPPPPEALGIEPDDEVVFICMTGHRSPPAARQYKKLGYDRVANLTWGTSAYALLGGDVVSGTDP